MQKLSLRKTMESLPGVPSTLIFFLDPQMHLKFIFKKCECQGPSLYIQITNEPARDKTYKIACAPSEDSDQPGHPPSLMSLRCALSG